MKDLDLVISRINRIHSNQPFGPRVVLALSNIGLRKLDPGSVTHPRGSEMAMRCEYNRWPTWVP
jgi:hypothetical protein